MLANNKYRMVRVQVDFIHGQETLSVIHWILRAVVAYFFMVIIVKVMGQRSISQLNILDFVIALIIGNIIAHPLSDEKLGLKGPMITLSILVVLYISNVFATLKSIKLRRFFLPEPLQLIKNGEIMSRNLSKARISIDFLVSLARKEKIDDISKIALAFWEPDGTISFFIKPDFQTVTRSDLQIVTEPFDYPRTIIREGKIDKNELMQIGKEESWLLNKLKTLHKVELGEVLFATIDHNNQFKIFLYK